jgi:predicted DNA-binding WGR domain protein
MIRTMFKRSRLAPPASPAFVHHGRWTPAAGFCDPAGMSTKPYNLYVERIDLTKSTARYYALSIETTLFGDTSLVRSWGRIGSRGQRVVHVFKTEGHQRGGSLAEVDRLARHIDHHTRSDHALRTARRTFTR